MSGSTDDEGPRRDPEISTPAPVADDRGRHPLHHDPRTDHESLAQELADYADLEVRELAELAEEAQTPGPKAKRWWVLPLRIVISFVMLAVLFRRIPDFEWSNLIPDWHSAAPLWLAAALGLTLAAVVLSALRWQQVLHALDIRAPLWNLVSYYFAGQFVSNVLPTTIGGDVLRISRLSHDAEAARRSGPAHLDVPTATGGRPGGPDVPTGQGHDSHPRPGEMVDVPTGGGGEVSTGDPTRIDASETFASVVLERLTGWLVLPLLTFGGLALDPTLRSLGRATSLAVIIAISTLIGLALILVAAGNPKVGGRLGSKQGWRRFISAVHLGVSRLRERPASAARVLLVGLAFQFVLVLAAAATARALGLDIGVTVLLAFYPAVLISQVLPIGISGLGVRESAFVIFLSPLGVPSEQAVALGLLLYGLNLVASLAGAPSFALGSRGIERPLP